MERRLVTIAAAVTLTVAAAAIVVQAPSWGEAADSAEAAHRPGTAAPEGVATGAGPTRLLRPDVFSLRARGPRISVGNGGRMLRFGAMLANDGPGPMVVRPRRRADCPPGQLLARQLVSVDRNRDGRFQRRTDTRVRSRRAGCMLDHPTHDHWHFDAMAAYRLVDPAPRRRVVGRAKVSFCLRDNQPIPGTSPRQRRGYYGDCGRTRVQGISPGWVDLYDASLPGQSLRLPRRMPDGVYCLVLRADPRDQLLEADESNNARARPVRIRGDRVSTPRVRACRGLLG
ncbi:MAG: lysyl oxidase family protein [Actinomycetota bacterium]|nr:lysyl oxidase family protein [Actinomycetota bacterium]